jgi:hypothetical protein
MRLLRPCFVLLPYGMWPASFFNVRLPIAVKNNSMRECFGVLLTVTEFISPMSRRRVTNRRELLLPLRIPDRHPTGVVFDRCVPADPTEAIHGEPEEPPETWTRHTAHCLPAKQTTQTFEWATSALIAGNHLLAQLVFLRIRPGTHRGTTSDQTGSPHSLQRTRPVITPLEVAALPLGCAEVPAPAAIPPEIETLMTQLARRRLRKRGIEETR